MLLVHGSGPGVSAFANWRLTMPALAEHFDVIAPDIVGFGFTDRPEGFDYSLESWRAHLLGFADALGLDTFSIVGNSFGGGLAISMAAHAPERVERLVLMGACGVSFPITDGLDRVWGYEPSLATMRGLLDIFAFDPAYATDELAELRYAASVRPGFPGVVLGDVPRTPAALGRRARHPGGRHRRPAAPHARRARPRRPDHPAGERLPAARA